MSEWVREPDGEWGQMKVGKCTTSSSEISWRRGSLLSQHSFHAYYDRMSRQNMKISIKVMPLERRKEKWLLLRGKSIFDSLVIEDMSQEAQLRWQDIMLTLIKKFYNSTKKVKIWSEMRHNKIVIRSLVLLILLASKTFWNAKFSKWIFMRGYQLN